jgi:murein DD-endopeptidase MepM/ murein hydrolase activator NlpD
MQLIWVSGPTAKVVTLSITARTIAAAVGGLCAFMLALGILFHFVGLRIAVEVSPAVAHAIGGVASVADHERLEARYRQEVQALQTRLVAAVDRLGELEKNRTELLALLGVRQGGIPRQPMAAPFGGALGQGGPLRLLEWLDPRTPSLEAELDQTSRQLALMDASLIDLQSRWAQEGQRLARLPSALPLNGDFYMSSGFGVRPDPITGQRSLHEGVDFVARGGTPVRAAGGGTVWRSDVWGDHGQVVEIEHDEGFLSRYAHLSRRHVRAGDAVARGQVIGELGNSGRTTGAHLHFEVEHQGRLVDPNRALAPLAWR